MAARVVIPALDEGATIAGLVAAVRRLDPRLGPVVVDDGSRDGTAEAARAAGALVVRHGRTRGNGAALKSGVALAGGDVLVFLDGDGQHDPRQIPRLLAEVADGADLVVACRDGFGASGRTRALGNHLLRAVASSLAGRAIPDLTSGFRAVRRAALEPLLPHLPEGFSTPTTSTMLLLAAGADVRFVPAPGGRSRRASHTRLLRDGPMFVTILLRLALRLHPPGSWSRPAAAALLVAAAALAAGLGWPVALGLALPAAPAWLVAHGGWLLRGARPLPRVPAGAASAAGDGRVARPPVTAATLPRAAALRRMDVTRQPASGAALARQGRP